MWSWSDDLTMGEADQLAELETTIARDLRTFYEVGQALTVIRDERLYRAGYDTFERSCQERWSIVRQRAYQLMDAAAIMSNVYSSRQTPTHEAQLRPLAGLSPTDQRAIWDLAAATAPDGIITAKHVKATADAYFGRTPKPAPPPPPPRGHDPHMDAWSWDDGRLSVLGLEPQLPQPPPHRPETTVVTVEIRLLGHTELELEAAIEHLHATSDAVGFHTVKAGRDGQWLAYGDMVLVVPAPAVVSMPAAGPAPAMGLIIRDLARAMDCLPSDARWGHPDPRAVSPCAGAGGGCHKRGLCLAWLRGGGRDRPRGADRPVPNAVWPVASAAGGARGSAPRYGPA